MSASAYKGFERLRTAVIMIKNMTFKMLLYLFIFHIVLSVFMVHIKRNEYFGGDEGICIAKTYSLSYLFYAIPFFKNTKAINRCGNEARYVDYTTMKYHYENFINAFIKNYFRLLVSLWIVYLVFPFTIIFFYLKNRFDTAKKIIRGTGLIPSQNILSYLKNDKIKFKGYFFKLTDNIYMPESIVTRHTFVMGMLGSGKSQLIYRIITQLISNNFKAIIHDFKGDMIPIFYDSKKHLIFNPLDKRHMNWLLFDEFKSKVDVLAFCNSFIPDDPKDPFWHPSARTVLYGILMYLIKSNQKTYEALWDTVNISTKELFAILSTIDECKSVLKLLEEEKTANNIRSVLSNFVACFEFLIGTYDSTKPTFSIKEWVQNKNSDKRIIYLSNKADLQDTLKPLLAMFVDFATKTQCSMPDDLDRRLYYILDEFGQLGRLSSIKQLLTQGRSKGAAVWILIQDISQINALYTKDGSTTIFNSCGNTIAFTVADYDTADFLSKNIGTIEVIRSEESHSLSISDMRDSISQSKRQEKEEIVLASELTNLESLHFYIMMVDLPVTKDSFEYKKFTETQESFIERPGFYFEESDNTELINKVSEVKEQIAVSEIHSMVGEDLVADILNSDSNKITATEPENTDETVNMPEEMKEEFNDSFKEEEKSTDSDDAENTDESVDLEFI